MASMRLHLFLIPLLLGVLLIPSLLPPTGAAAITVNVNQSSVSILMNFDLVDNLTLSLPTFDMVLDQSSPILQPIQNGFQSMVAGARIDTLTLHIRTAEINNTTGLWVFQENYTITLSGVTTNTGGRIIANLGFLSSRDNQSILVNGAELNNIGQSYLLQGFQRFPPDPKTRYFAGTGGFTQPLVPEQYTSAFSLLDLSWIAPVSIWPGGYKPFEPSTIWNLQPHLLPFNVTIGVGLTSENTYLKRYMAYLTSSLEIIAPPRAQAIGTNILFDTPTMAETIMPIIIAVSLVTAITTILLERRVLKSMRPVKGRRR